MRIHSEGSISRSKTQKNIFLGFLFCVFIAFLLLGTWQVFRLQWKNQLIERVDQRIHAAPSPTPDPHDWHDIQATSDEYRHVSVQGTFLYQYSAAVQASTELGPGYWLLTPLREIDGGIIYINRGFIKGIHPYLDFGRPDSHKLVQVTGLLRMSEPKGGFLRSNDPILKRWYSRDVQALAASEGIANIAPFFIDAQVITSGNPIQFNPEGGDPPVMGLTVIHFPNNHFVYAFTWYALALMMAIAYKRTKF